MKWRVGFVFLILTAALAVLPAAAKGTFNRVIITSQQLDQPIVLDDPLPLAFLSLGVLEDFESGGPFTPPAGAAKIGYDMERQWIRDGDYVTFDRVSYHPSIGGERGYIHMVSVEGGSASYEGQWLRATPVGEATLRAVLAGEPVECPVTPADDSTEQALIGKSPMWFTPPEIGAMPADGERSPNVTGSVVLGRAVRSNFGMSAVRLQDATAVMMRLPGTTRWLDHLDVSRVPASSDGTTRYEWEAIFPEPGCYALSAYAEYYGVQIYVEVKGDE